MNCLHVVQYRLYYCIPQTLMISVFIHIAGETKRRKCSAEERKFNTEKEYFYFRKGKFSTKRRKYSSTARDYVL